MVIYLIANNDLTSKVSYDYRLDIERKKEIRPLSINGIKNGIKLNIKDVDVIYSSTYVSCIESARFLGEKIKSDILLTEDLNDCKIGELRNQSLKMLSYFQEHNFEHRLENGESLKDCQRRIAGVIKRIVHKEKSAAVFLPRRALLSYLLKFYEHGFNLDERIVLYQNDEVVMESNPDEIEVFKMVLENNTVNIYPVRNVY